MVGFMIDGTKETPSAKFIAKTREVFGQYAVEANIVETFSSAVLAGGSCHGGRRRALKDCDKKLDKLANKLAKTLAKNVRELKAEVPDADTDSLMAGVMEDTYIDGKPVKPEIVIGWVKEELNRKSLFEVLRLGPN
jgi:hypothetical protein